ncbi:Listeria/Bacterioides repeat [Candidatus Nanopelagicaceae bacterium]
MGSRKHHANLAGRFIKRISRFLVLPLLVAGISLPSIATTQAVGSVPTITTLSSSFSTVSSGVVGGPLTGGSTVTITGTNLTGITGVTVGGVASTSVTFISDTSATFVTPAGDTNTAKNVVVTTNIGSVTKTNGFTYLSAVACGTSGNFYIGANQVTHSVSCVGSIVIPEGVTSIATAAFCNNNGSCYLTGSALGAITLPSTLLTIGQWAFMSSNAASVSITLPSSLTTIGYQSFTYTGITSIVIPKSVTKIAGAAFYKAFLLSSVTFEEPSSLTSLGEDAGPNGLGVFYQTAIKTMSLPSSLTNIGFYFRDTPVTKLIVNSNITSMNTPPPSSAAGLTADGLVCIVNTTNGAYVNNFAYAIPPPLIVTTEAGCVPQPTITSLSVATGFTTGGTSVRLTGTNLTGVNKVWAGSTLATNVTVESSTSLTFTTPAGTAGAVAISLSGPSGPALKSGLFTYVSSSITSVSPSTGLTTGGTVVTITGDNFTGATGVNFGTTAATFAVVDTYTITATSPVVALGGVVDVRVVKSSGTSPVVTADRFTYVSNNPKLSALTLNSGATLSPTFSGTTTSYTASVADTVTSINVTPTSAAGATIKVNGTTVASAGTTTVTGLVTGQNTIRIVTTAQDAVTFETYTVVVTKASSNSNDAKLSALTLSSGTLSPTFDSVTAIYSASVANAISSITVTPTVNQANAVVRVNGTTVASATASGSINLNVGSNTITVLNTAQDGTTTKSYTITVTRAPPAPTITNIDNSTPNYGSTVRITGTDFTGATSVQIGSTPVATFNVESSTSLTFVVNSRCCTAATVSVTTSGGTGTSGTTITSQPQLLIITSQPQAATRSVGQSVTFTVVASTPADTGTVTYQWFKGATLIGGATLASYTFTPAALADAGDYSVVLYNTIGGTTVSTASSAAALTVNKGTPSLSAFSDMTKAYGDSSFTVTAPTSSVLGTYSYTSSDKSVATVSGSTISVLSPGTSTITATFTPQNTSDYNSGGTITAILTVNKASQSPITVTSIAGTLGVALTLTSSGGSGTGAVTYSTSTAGCSISGSAPYTLSSNAERTCAVIATKASDSNYLSASSISTGVVITAIRYTVTYNGNLNSGGSTPSDTATYITGETINVLGSGSLVRTGYTFNGWTTDSANTDSLLTNSSTVTVNSANVVLYAAWTANQYVVTYDANGGTSETATATFTTGTTPLRLPTPTRNNFTFNGWFTATTNGTLIGLAGANYSPTESSTVHAQWTQNSLAGLPAGSLSFINSYQVSQLITVTSTFSTAGNTVTLVVPAGALPSGTSVTYWLLSDAAQQAAPLPGQNDYVLSMVVSWLNSDGTVPDAASGKPLSMTISNSAIKAGASVYSVVGGTATLLGVATHDGDVSVELMSDPQIYVVQAKTVVATNVVSSSSPSAPIQSVKITSKVVETGPTAGGNTLKIAGTFAIYGDCRITGILIASQPLLMSDWSVTSTELSIVMPANNAGLVTIEILNGCVPTVTKIDYLYAEAIPVPETPIVIVTPTPAPVMNLQPSASMKKIATYFFASGAINLTKAQIAELAKLAKKINATSAKTVLVYGYADSMPGANNSALSKKRASAAQVILSKLIKGKTLRIGWYGSSKPLAPGNSPKDNAKNRRVEIWTK